MCMIISRASSNKILFKSETTSKYTAQSLGAMLTCLIYHSRNSNMLLQQQLPHLTPVATKFPWTHSIQASPAPRTTYVAYYNKKNLISLPDAPKNTPDLQRDNSNVYAQSKCLIITTWCSLHITIKY